MILAIFSADPDRPQWNMDFYRDDKSDSKWGFLVWDLDGGFNYRGEDTEHDTLAWHLRQEPIPRLKVTGSPDNEYKVRSTLVLRRLVENQQFRTAFKSRFQVLLDTILSPEQLNATFDRLLFDYRGTEEVEKLTKTFKLDLVDSFESFQTGCSSHHTFVGWGKRSLLSSRIDKDKYPEVLRLIESGLTEVFPDFKVAAKANNKHEWEYSVTLSWEE